jgi:iron complex transport system substrate-binding protein
MLAAAIAAALAVIGCAMASGAMAPTPDGAGVMATSTGSVVRPGNAPATIGKATAKAGDAAAATSKVATIAGNGGAEVKAVDDTGVTVTLPHPAQRIISLAPGATELLFAAGAGPHVVGVIKGSDAPPQARSLPVIGDVNGLDLERIVALAPDLVVTWPYTTPGQVALLRARGLAVFTTDAHQVDGIARDVAALAVLGGTPAVGAAAAAVLRSRAAALTRAAFGRRPVRVFYQVAGAPLFTIGGQHLISRALADCGGVNVFADVQIPAPQVDIEGVLARSPDAIVAATPGARRPSWLDDWRAWPQLPAVSLRNLLVVDADLLNRPGPRFVDGMAQLCAALEEARGRLGG